MSAVSKIFPWKIKYVLVTDDMLIPLRRKAKKIPGGFMTQNGGRHISKSFEIRQIPNDVDAYYCNGKFSDPVIKG